MKSKQTIRLEKANSNVAIIEPGTLSSVERRLSAELVEISARLDAVEAKAKTTDRPKLGY